MCTVTYVPVNKGFILTSNRDVHISRKSSRLPKVQHDVLYPEDGEAGGTWIGTNKNGRTLCLLNGAFEKHQRKKSYRKSRGLIMLDLFELPHIEEVKKNFSLRNIEPFTVIWIEKLPRLKIYEFRWDGNKKHLKKLKADIPYIWSSSTLYEPEIKLEREKWFDVFMQDKEVVNAYHLMEFHKTAGKGDPENDVMMSRPNGVRTVSTTQINNFEDGYEFLHQNYMTTKASTSQITLSKVKN